MERTLTKPQVGAELKERILKERESRAENTPDLLLKSTKAASLFFEQCNFPTLKSEEWKYTNVKNLLNREWTFPATASLTQKDIGHLPLTNTDAHHIVLVNGQYVEELSQVDCKLGKLEVMDLKSLAESQPDTFEKYYNKLGDKENNAFSYMNSSFAESGVFIRIKNGKTLDRTCHIHHISDNRQGEILNQPRVLLVVEENAEAKFVEQHMAIGDKNIFVNAVTEIHVEDAARCEHYRLQTDDKVSHQVTLTHAHQAKDSIFSSMVVTLEGELIRNNVHVDSKGRHTESHLNGLYLLGNKSHVDNHTIMDHQEPDCNSYELYKGVMDDRSTGVFNGRIYVRQKAQKTNAFQSNKNIVLTDTAKINTKPQLEIWADDVKCSHGATTGQLDPEMLFYLRSRGIPQKQAKAMLMLAFANDVVDKIKIDSLKNYLEELIVERLQAENLID